MGALLAATATGNKTDAFKNRARFAQKIVDYVICDDNLVPVLLLELDDRTHSASKDKERDKMTASAGYPTLRIESRSKPPVPALRRLILQNISTAR